MKNSNRIKNRIIGLLVIVSIYSVSVCFGFQTDLYQFGNPESNSYFNPQADENKNTKFEPLGCSSPGLLISEFLANPAGTDSPFELIELRATRSINFASTPYSVVVSNNGTATAAGWIAGGALSYGFSITTGSVSAGDVVYVGGSSIVVSGQTLRLINTGTTGGDGFGTAATGGIVGNGGANADGIAVFDVSIASITNSTVPIDAIFYGTATGTAVVSGGTAGYQLPSNDRYTGGKLQTSSFLAPDPASAQYTVATGTYSTSTCSFTSARTWANSLTFTDNASSVILGSAGTPTIAENTTSTLIDLNSSGSGSVGAVLGDTLDPMLTIGADFTIADVNTPIASLTVTATSSNAAVVPNANLNLTGSGAARNLKVTPIAAGYSTIAVTVSDGALSSTYNINYAASSPTATNAFTRWHSGKADASTAIAIDSANMFVADDEDQALRLFGRATSGLPISFFDFTPNLALTDLNGGIPREVDIEASAQVGSRIYWLASHSNSATGASRPNRSRIFATDVSGVGAATTLAYVGRYDGLKTDLINWDTSNAHGLGANFFGLSASAAVGVIPEATDGSGFNIEGLVFAPDNSTAYVSFRAPIVPANTRTRALIVPVTNFASLVSGNPSAGPATFGTPIQLNLGGRGIREIKKNSSNEYLIVAGSADSVRNFALFSWTGVSTDSPILRQATLTGLNPESIVDVPVGLNTFSSFAPVDVQLLSDTGDDIYYGDGIAAKDLPSNQIKKFRSDIVNVSSVPSAAGSDVSGRVVNIGGRGLGNARITVSRISNGETFRGRTNPLGYFSIRDLPSGEDYIFIVNAKGRNFESRIINVSENITDLILTESK